MRIVMMIGALGCGGAERVCVHLANYWVGRGHHVWILTWIPGRDDFYDIDDRVNRIRLVYDKYQSGRDQSGRGFFSKLMTFPFRFRRYCLMIRRAIQRASPDVVVAFMPDANGYLWLASMGARRYATIGSERVYPHIHLGFFNEQLRRLAYPRLDHVVAVSHALADTFQQRLRLRKPVHVVPNPVIWPLEKQAPTVDPGAVSGCPYRLLAVGRLDSQKGFERLIDVFSRLAPTHPDWQLVILGDGAEHGRLQAAIEGYHLNDRVSLVGHIGNVADWYHWADLFVMSSLFEGFPNVLVEAMAHGLPAVSFDCKTGPSDIIRHQVDGLLVSDGDMAAFQYALAWLMADKTAREAYAERAKDVRDRFSLENVAALWEKLFVVG